MESVVPEDLAAPAASAGEADKALEAGSEVFEAAPQALMDPSEQIFVSTHSLDHVFDLTDEGFAVEATRWSRLFLAEHRPAVPRAEHHHLEVPGSASLDRALHLLALTGDVSLLLAAGHECRGLTSRPGARTEVRQEDLLLFPDLHHEPPFGVG